MSYEDISESMAAELTSSVGLQDDGDGMSESLSDAVDEQAQYEAEKDIPVSNDVQDTAQGELDREAEQDAAVKDKRRVPLAALHEERSRRQALEAQLAAHQQQYQQLLAQQQAIHQQVQQAAAEAAIPDFDEDPRGHIEAVKQQFAQQIEQLKSGQGQQPQHQQIQNIQQIEAQVQQESAVLAPVVGESEARFEAANPDYQQAFGHLMSAVEQNMRTSHPGINDQQLGMLRMAALVEVAKHCQANNVDPAAYVYSRAQAMGYAPAQRAPRREPNTSLSTLAGSAKAPDERGAVSASQISDMSEAEFDKFFNSMRQDSVVRPRI